MTEQEIWLKEPDINKLRIAHDLLACDPARAIRELRALVINGSIMSAIYLGYAYEMGFGVARDLQEAKKWYEMAYEKGSALALTQLGGLYFQQRNYAAAEQIFSRGVLMNDISSMYWLARIYLNNGEKLSETLNLLERATDNGHIYAERALGGLLLSGRFGIIGMIRGCWHCIRAVVVGFILVCNDPTSSRLK